MTNAPKNAADIEQAKRNAATARARVQTTAGALKQRVSPANLASEAKDKVKAKTNAIGGKASGAMRKRPAATSVVAGLAALIVLRKPLGKLRKALFGRKAKKPEAPVRDPRKSEDTIRAGEPPEPSITPRIARAVSQSNAAALNKE
jgi:hypothetical protein